MTTTQYKAILRSILKEERDGVQTYTQLLMHMRDDKVPDHIIDEVHHILADEKAHVRSINNILRLLMEA